KTLTRLSRPDVSLPLPAPQVGFIHRKVKDADLYFFANTSNTEQKVKSAIRDGGSQAEWWDPLTGKVSAAKIESMSQAGPTIEIDLGPYGSRVLVFSKRNQPQPPSAKQPYVMPAPIDLSAGWRVTFGENAKPMMMDQLRSWTDDETTRYFSGTAVYEKEV